MSQKPTGDEPSTTGSNGDRNARGRFEPGNKLAKGNPHARRVAELRSAALAAVTPEDIAAIIGVLVAKARDGDLAAMKLLLDRVLGRDVPVDGDAVELTTLRLQQEALLARDQLKRTQRHMSLMGDLAV